MDACRDRPGLEGLVLANASVVRLEGPSIAVAVHGFTLCNTFHAIVVADQSY